MYSLGTRLQCVNSPPPPSPATTTMFALVSTNSSRLWRMCGRYRRTTKEEELARIYSIPIPKQPDLPVSYNIAPSQNVLAIRFNPETRERTLGQLPLGLIPHWAKDQKIAYRTIARAETVDRAPSYRQTFLKRRCLIPADGFYEWRKTAKRSCRSR